MSDLEFRYKWNTAIKKLSQLLKNYNYEDTLDHIKYCLELSKTPEDMLVISEIVLKEKPIYNTIILEYLLTFNQKNQEVYKNIVEYLINIYFLKGEDIKAVKLSREFLMSSTERTGFPLRLFVKCLINARYYKEALLWHQKDITSGFIEAFYSNLNYSQIYAGLEIDDKALNYLREAEIYLGQISENFDQGHIDHSFVSSFIHEKAKRFKEASNFMEIYINSLSQYDYDKKISYGEKLIFLLEKSNQLEKADIVRKEITAMHARSLAKDKNHIKLVYS